MSKPVKPITFTGDIGTVTKHPAFGMVSVNRLKSTGTTLFASDLKHNEIIELRFYGGETQEIDGQIHHMRDHQKPHFGIQMSPAQWATMITSFGLGTGVPCTMTMRQEGELVDLPRILPVETTRQRFDRQIRESTEREIQKIRECQSRLAEMVGKGKAGKRELEELNSSLKSAVENLPVNLAYSTTLVQEAMDKIVSDGKAELEATAFGMATKLGAKQMQKRNVIEDNNSDVLDE